MNELFLNELKEKFGITFKNLAFLQEAFTHSSYVNEHRDCHIQDNERIEF